MNRHALLTVFLLSLLLFTACDRPLNTEVFIGTQGLVLEFSQNAPPDVVYEGTVFPVRMLLRNRGAQDVSYDQLLLTFGTDPLYISGGISPYFPKTMDPDAIAKRRDSIGGKKPGFPDGEFLAYSMPIENAFTANKVVGQRERPETTISAGVCYAYVTHFSSSVCIDVNAYAENLRKQPCVANDLAPQGGQGAPIAITGVKVQAYPIVDRELGIEVVRPYFTFTIEDVGGGQLMGPDTLPFTDACLLRSIPKEQLGAVRIEAFLINTPLECQPDGFVRLIDKKGEVRCTVSKNELSQEIYASVQNYQSLLLVNLSYIYKSVTETKVEIERLAGADTTVPQYIASSGVLYLKEGEAAPVLTLPAETVLPIPVNRRSEISYLPVAAFGSGTIVVSQSETLIEDESGTEWVTKAETPMNLVTLKPGDWAVDTAATGEVPLIQGEYLLQSAPNVVVPITVTPTGIDSLPPDSDKYKLIESIKSDIPPVVARITIAPGQELTVADQVGQEYSITAGTPMRQIEAQEITLLEIGDRDLFVGDQIVPTTDGKSAKITLRQAPSNLATEPTVDVQLQVGTQVTGAAGISKYEMQLPDGQVVSKCEAFANNKEKIAPYLTDPKDVANAAKITPAFSCSCGLAQCQKLSPSGKCVFELCTGAKYCCDTSEPAKPAPPPPSTVGAAAVEAAREELAFFEGKNECSPEVDDRMQEYYAAGGCSSKSCNGLFWSGAFISYVMDEADANFP